MIWQILVGIVIGALCGFVANKLMKGDSSSFLKNLLLGVVGGLVGGLIGNLIGWGGGWISSILLSIGGSCLVVWLFRLIFKK